ncbi:MAG: IS110 family transposase [Candidatus Sulfotelmatobacter sp.]
MRKNLRFVGLDVHKDSISVAVAENGREPARLLETIPADEWLLLKVLDRLGPKSRLRVCYEAGPTGYGLARQLNEQGICCVVVAPSLVPIQKNRRIKTDRRDAVRLAHFLRSGDLVEVSVPQAQTEAMRDLERAREDAIQVERVARQQLDKFLLRHGRRWSAGGKWTHKHWKWIKVQEFPEEASRRVFDDYIYTVEQALARVQRLTADIGELVERWTLGPLVRALQALRGVDLVTAVVLAAEIGNFKRFRTPKQLMAYLGLVPSEHSSGGDRRQGGITRTGNRHARWVLVEAAWNYRFGPCASKRINARRELVAAGVRTIAERAEQRLSRRFRRLVDRGKSSQKAVTAVARELVGFVWAIAQEDNLLAA